MYTVGLDKMKFFLILYSETVNMANKLENNKEIVSSSVINASNHDNVITKTNNHAKEVIFGSLLGDGKLEMSPRSVNARFGFTQAEEKRDYFNFVLNSLSSIGSFKYREYSYLDKRTGKTYKSLNFWTKTLPMLTELYHLFYFNKIKIVPNDLSLLTPVALAHWIQQDGSRGTSRGLYLCTDSFTHAEVQRLIQYLTERYKIKCSIHKTNGRYRIYILAKYVQTVCDLVLPFMHESMRYKLGV